MNARDALAAHFTTDLVAGPLLDDYAVEVARAERISAYRDAADWLIAEYPGPGADRAIRLAAARLRTRADEMARQ